jgi:hypothetical protein
MKGSDNSVFKLNNIKNPHGEVLEKNIPQICMLEHIGLHTKLDRFAVINIIYEIYYEVSFS